MKTCDFSWHVKYGELRYTKDFLAGLRNKEFTKTENLKIFAVGLK